MIDTPDYSNRGQGLIEYVLILVLIAVFIIIVLALLGDSTQEVLSTVTNALETELSTIGETIIVDPGVQR